MHKNTYVVYVLDFIFSFTATLEQFEVDVWRERGYGDYLHFVGVETKSQVSCPGPQLMSGRLVFNSKAYALSKIKWYLFY